MKRIEISIVGITSLLQRRFGEQSEVESGEAVRRVLPKDQTPREQATAGVYQNKEKEYYFPGAALSRLLREAGGGHKLKGTRKSLKYIVPAAVLVLNDEVVIRNADGKSPMPSFEVDSRPVTIPATKGRIMRHRPRFDKWSANFAIQVNERLLPVEKVHELLTEGGQQIGIGDFRPEKGGPFGTFRVTRWEEVPNT